MTWWHTHGQKFLEMVPCTVAHRLYCMLMISLCYFCSDVPCTCSFLNSLILYTSTFLTLAMTYTLTPAIMLQFGTVCELLDLWLWHIIHVLTVVLMASVWFAGEDFSPHQLRSILSRVKTWAAPMLFWKIEFWAPCTWSFLYILVKFFSNFDFIINIQ